MQVNHQQETSDYTASVPLPAKVKVNWYMFEGGQIIPQQQCSNTSSHRGKLTEHGNSPNSEC